MLTLAAHLVFHFLTAVLVSRVGRALCRLVKRVPAVAALVLLWGVVLGAWLIAVCWPHDLLITALGVYILFGYLVAMGVLARKLWDGTWGEFCDHASTYFALTALPTSRVPQTISICSSVALGAKRDERE